MQVFFIKPFILAAGLFIAAACIANNNNDYLLDTGDLISIQVHGEEDLSFETLIGGDGTIRYPFLGDIDVSGKSVAQVRQSLTQGLKGDYLDEPSVHVYVVEYRPFFILGEVKNPQGYPYQPGLTVNQAIAIAGGLTERGSVNDIGLKRKSDGKTSVIEDIELDFVVQPGDTITVRQRFF